VLDFLTLRRVETTLDIPESKKDYEHRVALRLAFVALALALGSVATVYMVERDSPAAKRTAAPSGVALYRMPIPF
jgi:hypothetical protein